jgi:hypothetical protein
VVQDGEHKLLLLDPLMSGLLKGSTLDVQHTAQGPRLTFML